MANIVIIIILITSIALVIKSMIKRKKQGKSLGCGGNCENCAGTCNCKIKYDNH